MKTTVKSTSQQIVNKKFIVSILLVTVLTVLNSVNAQDAYPLNSLYLNSELTEERLRIILTVDVEDEMEIEDWMINPAFWENVSNEIEIKYYGFVAKEDTEPELKLEPWMVNFHNEILCDNYYVTEEMEIEDWMLDIDHFQYVIRIVAEK